MPFAYTDAFCMTAQDFRGAQPIFAGKAFVRDCRFFLHERTPLQGVSNETQEMAVFKLFGIGSNFHVRSQRQCSFCCVRQFGGCAHHL
jgi:hypothetical protein